LGEDGIDIGLNRQRHLIWILSVTE